MQPASMLGAALVQGIGTDISHFQSLPGAVGVGQLRESAQHQFSQPSRQLVPPQLKMDDFLDQILLPSWSEMGGTIRAPWDYDSGSLANALNMDTEDCLSAPPNMSMLPSMTSGRVGRPSEIQGLSFQAREVQRKFSHRQAACFESGAASSAGHRQIDNMAPTLAQGPQGVQNPIPRISEGSSRGLGIIRSPTVISSGSEGSGNQLSPSDGHSVSTDALTRRPPFGVVSPPLHDDETRPGAQDHLFNNFAGQIGQLQIPGAPSQQSHQKVSQGVSGTSYASHTGLSQSQAAAGVAAGARTRVRARRGQATDPHSIAERLRRERIAERMKALQELVPNANKTDKASMLDEIIEYVKFLQLQVKVLSMSRLGGAGAVSPLVADFSAEGHDKTTLGLSAAASGPSQDGMAVTEHQVARLMEENMGSAMQFLQSKGLCLMPMSLATSISTTNSRSPTGIQSGMQEIGSANFLRPDVLSSTSAGCNINSVITGAMMPSATITCNGSGHGVATEEDRGLSYSDDRNQASAVENMNVAETEIHIFATETSIKNKHEDTS